MDDAVKIIERLCHVTEYYTVNMGHPEVIATEKLAMMLCELTGRNYDQAVESIPQPGRMTLVKCPSLLLQEKLTGYKPAISIEQGVNRVIDYLLSNRKK